MNNYLHFFKVVNSKSSKVSAENQNLRNNEISKIISEMWKNECKEVKLQWEILADEKKLEHMELYPNYVYRHKRSKKRNKTRKNSDPIEVEPTTLCKSNDIHTSTICNSNSIQSFSMPETKNNANLSNELLVNSQETTEYENLLGYSTLEYLTLQKI
ncbi:40734_t:CDS:2 [Gigaspora margarita]|uniref:40734_t:CDS:1 n=1 Tax=Gigaspora margarita TaxID=4874 RepID=A0ABN7UFP0_GIGMA|nr:40734_t:CDS:2 [Gigaspora margarita]